MSSLFATHATAAPMLAAGSTGPKWASGVRDGTWKQMGFYTGVQGGQLDNCGEYSIGDKGRNDALDWNDVAHPTGRGRQKLTRSGCKTILYALRFIPTNASAYYKNSCDIFLKTGNTTQYDSYFNTMAEELATYAPSFMIIRVGWEMNHKFPWSLAKCGTAAKIAAYKKTHQKVVTKLRSAFAKRGKTFAVSWNFLRESNRLPRPLKEYYPGDAYVDTISIDYYDYNYGNGLDSSTIERFRSMANRGTVAQPWGINKWFDFAMSMKKPFSVDEWGISNAPKTSSVGHRTGDNAAYIRGMHEFFSQRAGRTVQTSKGSRPAIGYENYFHSTKWYSDLGTSRSPKATAEYRRLWKR